MHSGSIYSLNIYHGVSTRKMPKLLAFVGDTLALIGLTAVASKLGIPLSYLDCQKTL